jgi:hypothetical protein
VAALQNRSVQTVVAFVVAVVSSACTSILETYRPAPVQTVHVTWTVNGQPASAPSCAGSLETLKLQLVDPSGARASTAVHCAVGAFRTSKVPTTLRTVIMYDASSHVIGSATLVNGSATLDLIP